MRRTSRSTAGVLTVKTQGSPGQESRRREINCPARNSRPMGAEEVNARRPIAAGCARRPPARHATAARGKARGPPAESESRVSARLTTTMQQYPRRLGLRAERRRRRRRRCTRQRGKRRCISLVILLSTFDTLARCDFSRVE